jgi:ABC-2 type transport system ATP-binding protein
MTRSSSQIIPRGVAREQTIPYVSHMAFSEGSNSPSNAPGPVLAVSTSGLTKQFGDRTVVDGLDLAIPVGVVCGFVGPNGAGKTTTLRMLLGLIRPTSGVGSILGGDLTKPDSYLSKVGALIESPAFYPQLTGRANLTALARLSRVDLGTVERVLDRVGLSDRADDKFHSYSLGMKQRLGIAASLLAEPQLLILDEPTNGLDPAGILEMRGLIRSFSGEGITVVISSHLIAEIEQICDFLVIIRAGTLVHQGPTAELRRAEKPDLLVAPEFGDDLGRLGDLLRSKGCTMDRATGIDALLITRSPLDPAEINRAAANAGITLRTLAESSQGLEQAFFALTGTSSRDVHHENELGAIR